MVLPEIWAAVAGKNTRGFLCIGCLEKRLGRPLVATDFTGAPVNDPSPWNTPRLAAALARPPHGRRTLIRRPIAVAADRYAERMRGGGYARLVVASPS